MLKIITKQFILKNRHRLGAGASFKANVRQATLALQTTVVVAVFSFVIFILDLSFNNYPSAIADVSLVVIALMCYLLICKGYISTGKMILTFTTLFVITLNASKEGPNAGNEFLWVTVLVGLFALFSLNEKKHLIICLIATVLTLTFSYLTNFTFLLTKELDPSWEKTNHDVVMLCCIIVILFFLFSIAKSMYLSFDDKDKDNTIIRSQKKELQHANDELDKFVYHASHDLRAPLTSMLGLIEVSKKEADVSKLLNLLDKQEETILKLDDYVQDILFLSRIKRTSLNHSLTDVNKLIDGVLKQCQFMLDEKQVKVTLNSEIDRPFLCDQSRINIVLTNILSNSIKYTDDKKKENQIDIFCQIKGKNLTISIKDNGIGIAPASLEKVTEMFYYDKNQNKGTGLGLYIVKETLARLGGKLTIDSKSGEFAQFSFTIPEATDT